jgi:putative glutamine amidotransferase
MQKKPLIGINIDYKSETKDTAAYFYLAAGYSDCVLRAGGIPVMVPIMDEEDDIEAVLDTLDGFILVGGLDLDPHRDGFMRHTSCRLMSARREMFDRQLARLIFQRKLPVFGIGVGMQLLNYSGRQPSPAHSRGSAKCSSSPRPSGSGTPSWSGHRS